MRCAWPTPLHDGRTPSIDLLRVGQRARRILLEVEDAAGDAFARARREILCRAGDIERFERPAERPGRDCLLDPLVALAFLLALDAPLPFGERPADVDLVDA